MLSLEELLAPDDELLSIDGEVELSLSQAIKETIAHINTNSSNILCIQTPDFK